MPTDQNPIINSSDRFIVYASRLKDSPYTAGEDEWPQYHEDKVSNLANEILNGNKTCYLISGYRGVGKTSFIRQVEEKAERLLDEKRNINTENGTSSEEVPECLFVLTNFAKYENHKSLLRRMIRDVYQEYRKNEAAKVQNEEEKKVSKKKSTRTIKNLLVRLIRNISQTYKKNKAVIFQNDEEKRINEKKIQEKEFKEKIEDLYKRTFQDIKTQLSISDSSELKITGESDVSGMVKKYLPLFLQTIISGAGSYYFIKQWLVKAVPLTIILGISLTFWLIFNLFKVSVSFTRKISKESKSTLEEIYDDEIAHFKFQELLDSFNSLNYRLVFVLDELDKVNITDLDNLIKEMKPYLLSGKAHFIIVAGQELAYRYLWAYSGDDAVIGSLFSKFYHIPLFTRDNLEEIGKRFINFDNASPDSISKLSPLFDYLIFKCRRVPRSFIARFRQIVVWDIDENKEQTAYIKIPDKQTTELQVQILAMIREIERLSITPKQYEPVLNDYLITQLFINAQQMIFKKDYFQSVNDYLEHYSKSDQLADKAYYQNVEEIIRDLFSRMKQENIIKEKTEEVNPPVTIETVSGKKDETSKVEVHEIDNAISTPELPKFKNEWIGFISALNLFWNDEVNRNPSLANTANTTYNFLEYFNTIKAVSFTPIHEKSLIELINNLHLIQWEDRLKSFRDQLRSYSINPLAFQRQLTEFIIRQQLKSKLGKNYSEQILTGFDSAFISRNSTEPDMLIDFRHSELSESDRSDIEKIIEKLSDYNLLSKKGNTILIIETFFNPDSKINQDLLIQDFNSLIEKLNPSYYGKIAYYPVPNRIEKDTLEKLAEKCINNLSPYREFAIFDRVEEKQKMIRSLPNFDAEDPQRFLWGEKSEIENRKLTATVAPIGKESKKFNITLTVRGSEKKSLRGFVYFLVHPSFPEEIYKILAKNNSAILHLDGYEAFTTGAVCDDGATELELNLNNVEGIPDGFRYTETSDLSKESSIKRPPKRSISVKKRMKK
jgi:hypothetical protein